MTKPRWKPHNIIRFVPRIHRSWDLPGSGPGKCQGERKAGTSIWFGKIGLYPMPKSFSLFCFFRPIQTTESYSNSAWIFSLTILPVKITFHIHLQNTPFHWPVMGRPSSHYNQSGRLGNLQKQKLWLLRQASDVIWYSPQNRQHVFFLLAMANASKSIK